MRPNKIRVQLDGCYRFARLEYAMKFTLLGFGSRKERSRFRRLMRNTIGMRATIGERSELVPLTKELLDAAQEGSRSALDAIRGEIVHAFTKSQTADSAP